MSICAFGDPTCPCQDGQLCHYVDDPVTGTLAAPPYRPYEFGVKHRSDRPTETHRNGMTEAAAVRWVQEWLEDGGHNKSFRVVRRAIGRWEDSRWATP